MREVYNTDLPNGWNPHKRGEAIPHKVLYLFDDPAEILLSYYCNRCMEFGNKPQHVANMGGDSDGIKKWKNKHGIKHASHPKGIDDNLGVLHLFLDNGVDFFQIERHFRSWYELQRKKPVMFIKYPYLHEYRNDIAKFFDKTPNNKFTNWKPRPSRMEQCDPELQQKINDFFQGYREFYFELDEMFIKC